MSRLYRYRESVNRFIRDKSNILSDKNHNIIIQNEIKRSDFILPILFLTVLNNQSKKYNLNINGYNMCAYIESLHLVIRIIDKRREYIQKYDEKTYNDAIQYLLINSNKLLYQCIESIQHITTADNIINIIILILSTTNNYINYFITLNTFERSNIYINNDVVKWYIKNNNQYEDIIVDDHLKIYQVNNESFLNYLNNKLGNLCELLVILTQIITMNMNNEKELILIKNASKYFAILYKLSNDFYNLNNDTKNNNELNYVINYGIEDSYEFFIDNKQKFIEACVLLNIYSITIKEILNYMEESIDNIIDTASIKLNI